MSHNLTLEEIQKTISDEYFGYGYEVTKSAIRDLENYIPRIREDIQKVNKKLSKFPVEYHTSSMSGTTVRLTSQQEIDLKKQKQNLEHHLISEIQELRALYRWIRNNEAQAQRKTFKLVMASKLKEVKA